MPRRAFHLHPHVSGLLFLLHTYFRSPPPPPPGSPSEHVPRPVILRLTLL